MEDNIHELVYSKPVIEFVTVANEYCKGIEAVNKIPVEENLQKIQKILPLLYLKTTMLPGTESVLEDELEKYLSELDYNVLQQKWSHVLGEHDSFYEVFDPSIQFGQETVTATVSENLMDIYQSLKDFLEAYSMGNDEVMNDALYQCCLSFEEYWGQNLVNVLRAVHQLVYSEVDFEKEDDEDEVKPGRGNPKWLDKFWGTETDEDE